MPNKSDLEHFLGGSSLRVIIKLIILSLIVGAALAFVDLSPLELLNRFWRFLTRIFDLGFGALGDLGQWLAAGALIVVPIFIISRLWRARK